MKRKRKAGRKQNLSRKKMAKRRKQRQERKVICVACGDTGRNSKGGKCAACLMHGR